MFVGCTLRRHSYWRAMHGMPKAKPVAFRGGDSRVAAATENPTTTTTKTTGQNTRTLLPPQRYPVTPDGHYFVVRGRLWRCTDPSLTAARRAELTAQLMDARRALRGRTTRSPNDEVAQRASARARVQAAKEALGERGPAWWRRSDHHDDDADEGGALCDRKMARNTPYAAWYATLNVGSPSSSMTTRDSRLSPSTLPRRSSRIASR